MKKRYNIAFGIILYIGLMYVVAGVQAYRDWAFICERTGSRKGYREWLFGVQTGDWYQKSSLEDFMREKHPEMLEHRWTSYAGTGYNIIGMRMLCGHGRPGAIIHIPVEWLNKWVQTSKPEEILELYRLLASEANEETKQQRIDEISEEAIEQL